jgi:hypothetical protein
MRRARAIDWKPRCKLTGTDGNVFALAARVATALQNAHQPEKAAEMKAKLLHECHSYDEALRLFMAYVDVR